MGSRSPRTLSFGWDVDGSATGLDAHSARRSLANIYPVAWRVRANARADSFRSGACGWYRFYIHMGAGRVHADT